MEKRKYALSKTQEVCKIRKLGICLFVHDVKERDEWFRSTVKSINKQYVVENWSIHMFALHDKVTDKDTLDYLAKQGFMPVECGESQLDKFDTAMNMDVDYVAIAHDDDPWTPEKLTVMLGLVDESPVIVSAYTTRHEDGRGNTYECPVKYNTENFLTYCVMSGWILKTGIKYDPGSDDWYGIEQRLLASLNHHYPVTINVTPTFQYTEHQDRISDNREGGAEMWENSVAYMRSIPSHKTIFKAYYDQHKRDVIKWSYM